MENQANSKSIILNFGLYYGLAGVFLNLVFYALGMHLDPGIPGMIVGLVVMIALIILATKKFKSDNGGFMSWGQGVKVGLGVVLIGIIINIIYQQIFQNFIEPDYMNQVMINAEQKLNDMGLTQEQIESQMEMSKKFSSPLMQSSFALLGGLFFGFIASAITSAVMKKNEEETY